MVHNHKVDGIHFRTYPEGPELFSIKYSRTGFGDWKQWPGFFLRTQKRATVLKSVARVLNRGVSIV